MNMPVFCAWLALICEWLVAAVPWVLGMMAAAAAGVGVWAAIDNENTNGR